MAEHEADKWIADRWMGKQVRQIDGLPTLIGRIGRVAETMFDEKGALHCRMEPDGWWCPALLLKEVE